MYLRVLITAETPLSFRDGTDLLAIELNRYIPGTALLGALAEAHVQRRNDQTEFAALFLRERVRFGNAYPEAFNHEDLNNAPSQPVRPLPLTARSGKRFPGFRGDGRRRGDRYDGVTDALLPLALFALSGEQRADLLDPVRSAGSGAAAFDLDRISGFYRRDALSARIGRAQLTPSLRSHTGINYHTGTVQQNILYSTQVLPEGSHFWAAWRIPDGDATLAQALESLVEDLVAEQALRLGNNRTRGCGRILMQIVPADEADDCAEALAERVAHFNRLFHAAAHAAQLAIPAGIYLPLTLTSDALLHDHLLRPRVQLTPADLAAVGIPAATLVFHTATARRVRGWNSLLGMPRADTWAIGMGAVFLFRLPADFTNWQALLSLQVQGVGMRRAEGYGQLSVADAFHQALAGGVMA
ncbi:MAG: hypothetical protein EI684_17340 [Candidatus Viridilinea halotolerans]|uniref:CRISPR type III-associated protein domain-containing protein n=1 Tax=Candidatus Viridilinea halotolerans TaxID=2491704 RepID=A0A426TU74_9CHLR|nr:MAG: hypothetical protein EI684_17340 [Candidatus Viridilinea halotolerans]